jgi:hypothetical protein
MLLVSLGRAMRFARSPKPLNVLTFHHATALATQHDGTNELSSIAVAVGTAATRHHAERSTSVGSVVSSSVAAATVAPTVEMAAGVTASAVPTSAEMTTVPTPAMTTAAVAASAMGASYGRKHDRAGG